MDWECHGPCSHRAYILYEREPLQKIKPTKHIYKVKQIQIDIHINNRDRNAKRHCVNHFLELSRPVTKDPLKEKVSGMLVEGRAHAET